MKFTFGMFRPVNSSEQLVNTSLSTVHSLIYCFTYIFILSEQ